MEKQEKYEIEIGDLIKFPKTLKIQDFVIEYAFVMDVRNEGKGGTIIGLDLNWNVFTYTEQGNIVPILFDIGEIKQGRVFSRPGYADLFYEFTNKN